MGQKNRIRGSLVIIQDKELSYLLGETPTNGDVISIRDTGDIPSDTNPLVLKLNAAPKLIKESILLNGKVRDAEYVAFIDKDCRMTISSRILATEKDPEIKVQTIYKFDEFGDLNETLSVDGQEISKLVYGDSKKKF